MITHGNSPLVCEPGGRGRAGPEWNVLWMGHRPSCVEAVRVGWPPGPSASICLLRDPDNLKY